MWVVSIIKMAKRFNKDATAELEALAKAGMRGIGGEYDDLIQLACERTKLSEKQVKVCTAVCIGHHDGSVLVQKWYQPVSAMLNY